MREEWRRFPLDRRYEVSSIGRLRNAYTKKIRLPAVRSGGYLAVVLTHPQAKPKGYDIHYMVARTFIGIRPTGYDVSHQDGNRFNNTVTNLKYESRRVNCNKAFNVKSPGRREKLTQHIADRIRATPEISVSHWSKLLGVSFQTIWNVRKGIRWT